MDEFRYSVETQDGRVIEPQREHYGDSVALARRHADQHRATPTLVREWRKVADLPAKPVRVRWRS